MKALVKNRHKTAKSINIIMKALVKKTYKTAKIHQHDHENMQKTADNTLMKQKRKKRIYMMQKSRHYLTWKHSGMIIRKTWVHRKHEKIHDAVTRGAHRGNSAHQVRVHQLAIAADDRACSPWSTPIQLLLAQESIGSSWVATMSPITIRHFVINAHRKGFFPMLFRHTE